MEQNLGWPSQFEDLWPLSAQGQYVVQTDDQLVVASQNPDGTLQYYFSGFAQIPQVDLNRAQQDVTFAAVGVEARAYDDVVHTRVQRDADDIATVDGSADVEIHASCRFNPADESAGNKGGYRANCTSLDGQVWTTITDQDNNQTATYPVFLDPLLAERDLEEGTDFLDPWYISTAAIYFLNLPDPADNYVNWPDNDTVRSVLKTLAPPDPDDKGPLNQNTATTSDDIVRDYDATGKAMVEALEELFSYCGVYLTWQIQSDSHQMPETSLYLFRVDGAAAGTPKTVLLAARGATQLDLNANNAAALHLARDANRIVNAWRAETQQKLVEVTVLLAPLFQPAAGDEQSSSRQQFFASGFNGSTSADVRRKYRWYGADECGDGHYNALDQDWVTEAIDLTPVFPVDSNGNPTYVTRYRPGSHTVIATDKDGDPLKAVLEVYYQQGGPGQYSGDPSIQTSPTTTNWFKVPKGWKLLDDRLGIEVMVDDPEQWNTGNETTGAPRRIAGVSQVTIPGTNGVQPLMLRLTTVIHADRRIKVESPKRFASPTQFARWREVDGKDHWQYTSIHKGSQNYTAMGGNGTDPVVVRDDTKTAQSHVDQQRSTHEFPPLAGTVRVPYITTYYEIGDRINEIDGRNVSLQTNVGSDQGEAPTFPWVVGVSWTFSPRQETILTLSDRRTDRSNL